MINSADEITICITGQTNLDVAKRLIMVLKIMKNGLNAMFDK